MTEIYSNRPSYDSSNRSIGDSIDDKRVERRGEVREMFKEPFVFYVSYDQSGTARRRKGKGIDISAGGICLETPSMLKNNQVIRLMLPLSVTGINMPILGEVRWVKRLGGRREKRIGIKFIT